jgi:hypothetical protein
MIPTNWNRPSDCWPWWSNHRLDDINNGTPTFSGTHKGPSHGYSYNPYHTIDNIPPLAFNGTYEGPSHGYDYNPYYTVGNVPPPTSSPQARTRDKDEEDL